ILLWSINLFAQAPGIEWQRSLGGTAGEDAFSIKATPDGGYITAGYAESMGADVIGLHGGFSDFDCWVTKLDAFGNLQWQKCLGGHGADFANYIQLTGDGGYIITGYTLSNDGDVSGN